MHELSVMAVNFLFNARNNMQNTSQQFCAFALFYYGIGETTFYDSVRLAFCTGDEWDREFSTKLKAGETYLSKDGGVRLKVQDGSLTGPEPGPVELHFSAQILRSHGQDYLTHTIVHCPANVKFKDPLLLEFLLDNPDISSGKGGLQQALEIYQVSKRVFRFPAELKQVLYLRVGFTLNASLIVQRTLKFW